MLSKSKDTAKKGDEALIWPRPGKKNYLFLKFFRGAFQNPSALTPSACRWIGFRV